MKPYLAILIDSFWEAVGNKVLWALLIGWSLVLAGLAPFGYISERSFQLSSADIDNRTRIIEKLSKATKGQGDEKVIAVAERLSPEFIAKLRTADTNKESNRGSGAIKSSELAKALNAAIESKDFYTEEVFPRAKKRARLEPLIEDFDSGLTDAELEELNRELLQLAFPLELNRPRGEQLWIGYAGFKIGQPLAISRRQISQFLEPLLLQTVIKLGLGILAIFVAIVVTSPIIPDTFRSGSLHLLLSKPISRIWLYVSKFFGSCIFVLVNITFVLVGLYFIAGIRFDIWNSGLMACIPLLMFVFVIFYSVSALAGLVWGNAIVCVVTCMIFWLFCFSVGFMHDAMLPQVDILPQLKRIQTVEDRLLVVNQKGELSVWNDEFDVWQPAIPQSSGGQMRTFGPIYLKERNLVLTKSFFQVPFGNMVAGSRKLELIRTAKSTSDTQDSATADDPTGPLENSDGSSVDSTEDSAEDSTGETPISSSDARETPVWISDQGPELPAQLFDLVNLDGNVIAICRGGIYRLDLNKLELIEASEQALFGLKLPFGMNSAFEKISPSDYFLTENTSASVTQDGRGLVILSSNSLDRLDLENGKLTVVKNGTLEGDGTEAALVQMNSDYCVVARSGMPLVLMNNSFEPLAELEIPRGGKVRQLSLRPDSNQVGIITHTGEFLILDCESKSFSAPLGALGEHFSCVNWLDSQRAWFGSQPDDALLIDVESASVEQRLSPGSTTFRFIFNWIVRPLYTVNPKPAALDNAMSYLLSGNETQSMNLIANDLEAAQIELDVWRPVVSNLAFVAVMLGIACIYVARKEF